MNKEFSTLQLVLNGQLHLHDPQKLIDVSSEVPDVKCLDTNQIYWQSQMENQGEKMPLITFGNSSTCSILLNSNLSS